MSEAKPQYETEAVLDINSLPWVKNIGTKIVDLVPMSATEAERYMSHKICMDDAIKDNGEGYLVRYKDGYVSWSPKTPADEAYRPISTRCETKAPKTRSSIPHSKTGVTMMRPYAEGEDLDGITVSEHGSPVKGGMICHAEDNVQDQWYISPEYYRENYVSIGATQTLGLNIGQALQSAKAGKKFSAAGWNGKGMFVYHVTGHFDMKMAGGSIMIGWTPNQADMEREDYYIVAEPDEGKDKVDDYQSRVVYEKNELQVKIAKLIPFNESAKFRELPPEDQADLKEQLSCMVKYVEILSRRIKNFPKEDN